jgi:hypothetical protein
MSVDDGKSWPEIEAELQAEQDAKFAAEMVAHQAGKRNGHSRKRVAKSPEIIESLSSQPEKLSGTPVDPTADPVEIELTTCEAEVGDQTISVLSREPNIYQRAGRLCRISTLKKIARTKQGACEQELPAVVDEETATLRSRMTRMIHFVAWRKDKNGKPVRTAAHPPRWLTDDVLSRRTWPDIRVLEAITESPVLRFDGSVLDRSGYDALSGLYFAPTMDFGSIAESPTRDAAVSALGELAEVFECIFRPS